MARGNELGANGTVLYLHRDEINRQLTCSRPLRCCAVNFIIWYPNRERERRDVPHILHSKAGRRMGAVQRAGRQSGNVKLIRTDISNSVKNTRLHRSRLMHNRKNWWLIYSDKKFESNLQQLREWIFSSVVQDWYFRLDHRLISINKRLKKIISG